MDKIIGIYKNDAKIFTTKEIDPMIVNIINGLMNIAKVAYSDIVESFEMEGLFVRCMLTPTGITIFTVSRERWDIGLNRIYEAYSKAVAHEDIGLLHVLLNY